MIEHWNTETDGELNQQNMQAKLVNRGYRVNCYIYPSGTYFADHSHNVDKIDGVLSGTFRMTMHGKPFILKAGNCIDVPRGAVHSAEVIGDESVISLDAVKR